MLRALLLLPIKAAAFAAFFYACGGFIFFPFGG